MTDRGRTGAHRSTIVCWGELLWDLLPDGRRLGGSAANVAVHAAQLGNRAVLVSTVGDDEPGHAAVDALAQRGVCVEFVRVDPTAPTGSVAVTFEADEPRFSIATRAAWDGIRCDDALLRVARDASAVCFGTLAQRTPVNGDGLRALLGALGPTCPRICDLNVRAPWATPDIAAATIDVATVIKLNEHEATWVEQAFACDDAPTWLLGRGSVAAVALTRAARGCTVVTGGQRRDLPGVVVATNHGDAVGAGDAFTAVLAHHLARGTELHAAASAANGYAAFVASARGATPVAPPPVIRTAIATPRPSSAKVAR